MHEHDLESRISKLEKALSAFSQELRLALRYIQPDAASSLTKSRVVLEKLLVQVYTAEMGQEPRKPLLGDMLVDNQFTRRIERRILSRMNAIRDMGNLGPHGEVVEAKDAARVLDDLCEVLEWYLRRYGGSTQPDPSGDGGQSVSTDKTNPTGAPYGTHYTLGGLVANHIFEYADTHAIDDPDDLYKNHLQELLQHLRDCEDIQRYIPAEMIEKHMEKAMREFRGCGRFYPV